MTDAVILAIVAVLTFFALRGAAKHFGGESPCCGGGAPKAPKTSGKKLKGPPVAAKTVKISGMRCERCARRISEAIDKIEGAAAKVSFRDGTAEVSCDRPVKGEAIIRAVEDAGYKVISITERQNR